MAQPTPNLALKGLDALVGEWKMVSPQFPKGGGRATFAWVEGGAFLIQRTEIDHPAAPNATMIIGCDESTETYCVLYHDERGVSRIYQMSIAGGVWKLWRAAPGFHQRFMGTFSADGTTIQGSWDGSADGSRWKHDFDLTYTRIGGRSSLT